MGGTVVGVLVDTGVSVGGTGVLVGVSVGPTGVLVGVSVGTGVFVDVLVAVGVGEGGSVVGVSAAGAPWAKTAAGANVRIKIKLNTIAAQNLVLLPFMRRVLL